MRISREKMARTAPIRSWISSAGNASPGPTLLPAAGFKAEHPHIRFCVNGEGEAPLRVAPVDCEMTFGPNRDDAADDVLFRDFVLPISSPEDTGCIVRTRLHHRLEGFPLLHLDFYEEDPQVTSWTAWPDRTCISSAFSPGGP
jgi:hypothetical protein